MKTAAILAAVLALAACQPRENFDPNVGMMMMGMGQAQTYRAQPVYQAPAQQHCTWTPNRLGGYVQTCY